MWAFVLKQAENCCSGWDMVVSCPDACQIWTSVNGHTESTFGVTQLMLPAAGLRVPAPWRERTIS